jgi:hypothetical protein
VSPTILVATDTATLALFDPITLGARQKSSGDWWCGDFSDLPEVKRGTAAFVSLGSDGVYSVRITGDSLTEDEANYASEAISLGVVIESGHLFIGPGECIPGGGETVVPSDADLTGRFVPIAPGAYLACIHSIQWHDAPQWYMSAGTHPGAPPDVVVILTPREGKFTLGAVRPQLFRAYDQWLFPARQRRLGPEPGMRFETAVVKRRDDLVLKPCGPRSYRPKLSDMRGLSWHDRVIVEVVRVDHQAKEFIAVVCGPAA